MRNVSQPIQWTDAGVVMLDQRRLPTEVEWEIAAHATAGRGFRWGDVHEWTAGTFRPWPDFSADPWESYSLPWFERARVLRGASFATRARMKHPKFRGFALPSRDDIFVGFRSCAACMQRANRQCKSEAKSGHYGLVKAM